MSRAALNLKNYCEINARSIPPMNQPVSNPLELLVPWDLPTEQRLPTGDRIRVEQALQFFLRALHEPSPTTALDQVEQAIAVLGQITTEVTQIQSTKTALKQPQIEDYDQYFEVTHVQSPDPIGCIIRSLLVTYQRLLQIWQTDRVQFEPHQIELQKQGFISYVHLLARILDLNLLDA